MARLVTVPFSSTASSCVLVQPTKGVSASRFKPHFGEKLPSEADRDTHGIEWMCRRFQHRLEHEVLQEWPVRLLDVADQEIDPKVEGRGLVAERDLIRVLVERERLDVVEWDVDREEPVFDRPGQELGLGLEHFFRIFSFRCGSGRGGRLELRQRGHRGHSHRGILVIVEEIRSALWLRGDRRADPTPRWRPVAAWVPIRFARGRSTPRAAWPSLWFRPACHCWCIRSPLPAPPPIRR